MSLDLVRVRVRDLDLLLQFELGLGLGLDLHLQFEFRFSEHIRVRVRVRLAFAFHRDRRQDVGVKGRSPGPLFYHDESLKETDVTLLLLLSLLIRFVTPVDCVLCATIRLEISVRHFRSVSGAALDG